MSLARTSLRTAVSASMARPRIVSSTECSENFATSKSSVSDRHRALCLELAARRSRYSYGASAARRGSPMSVSACSMRAYAAITARRGSGSRRRSSIASSSSAAAASEAPVALRFDGLRRRDTTYTATTTAAASTPAPITSGHTISGDRVCATDGAVCWSPGCVGNAVSPFSCFGPTWKGRRATCWPIATATTMNTR